MRFLVTAGNTRERIDKVRDWGNIFTGNTGFGIARALAQIGEVDLLTSNTSHLSELSEVQAFPHRIAAAGFVSHGELKAALDATMRKQKYDGIFMTAAVADYKPERVYAVLSREVDAGDSKVEHWTVRDVHAGKVKSEHPSIAILGQQTEKLVDLFRSQWGYRGLLVKFKLEVGITVEDLLRIGQASRRSSGANYLVANTLDMVSGPSAGAYLLSDAGHEFVPRGQLAERLAELVRQR